MDCLSELQVTGPGERWKLAGIVVLVINVTLLIAIAGTLFSHSSDPTLTVATGVLTSAVNVTLEKSARNSDESGILERQISLYNSYERDGSNLQKPSAHLVISPVIVPNRDMVTLQWNSNSNMAHMTEAIELDGGAITVRRKGYYYIYSTILYHGNGTQELDYGRIIHAVMKQKASELEEAPTPLMRNLQSTPSIRRGRLAYTTSSLGATFYLEANTRVKVISSVPDNINNSPHNTYFGLFLV
ncbi:tumor necrosis factor-like [Haliotis cracherodii]|uniref:tumor necrosis factor-like n=1 Tax=Haliotis cracherodii TaxID=6455 RepID=UPI0039EBB192